MEGLGGITGGLAAIECRTPTAGPAGVPRPLPRPLPTDGTEVRFWELGTGSVDSEVLLSLSFLETPIWEPEDKARCSIATGLFKFAFSKAWRGFSAGFSLEGVCSEVAVLETSSLESARESFKFSLTVFEFSLPFSSVVIQSLENVSPSSSSIVKPTLIFFSPFRRETISIIIKKI